jgi:putative membrane-bound dehydrogenase-like protein
MTATVRNVRVALASTLILALFGGWSRSGEEPIRVPPGFVVERVAGPPLVMHPMFACFDDRGRLYVADSVGVNLDGDALKKNPPHRIRILEDDDGDGRFDRGSDFAAMMTYPQGVIWHDGAVFTASPPSLWRLDDTDGDGVADRREELVTGWVLTGVADELHGPSLGPDGRIYWFCGRFPHEIRRPGGPVLRRGRSPLVLRCRPDGRDVEILSGAHGNPVKAAFTPEGEPLVCGTWSGADGDRQDVIIHCVEGGNYPVLDGEFGEHKRTGDLLPPLTKLGVAAASGVARSRGTSFPDEYRGNLFSALFNMHKVMRHVVSREGSTFRCRDEDFLTSDAPDFRPTDVLEDADGSLLVVDTGSWFSHCPTSKVGAERVEGGIYRVRRAGAAPVDDARGRSIAWDRLDALGLSRLLDDPRFAVRDRAVAELARRGPDAIGTLRDMLRGDTPARARRNAVWVLARIDGDAARSAVRIALADDDPSVRLSAVTAAGLHRDAEAAPALIELVKSDDSPAVRREAATALGRMHHAEAVPALLDALRPEGDLFLDHALIYALITIADRPATRPGLADQSPRVRRGALLALDQMDDSDLTLDQALPLLGDPAPEVQQAALRVIADRPAWAAPMVDTLGRWLGRDESDEARRAGLREALAAFSKEPAVQDVMARALREEMTPIGTRLLILEAMARAPLDRPPAAWVEALRGCLDRADEREVRQAVAIVRASGTAECDDALGRLAADESRPEDIRIDALAALAPRLTRLEPRRFDLLREALRPDRPPLRRLAAAGALGRAPLDEDRLAALAGAIAEAGALELPRLLPAFERGQTGPVGTALVAALDVAPGLRSLAPDAVRQALRSYPEEVRDRAGPLIARLESDRSRQETRLAELRPLLDRGDRDRGKEIFFGQKAACTTCHAIGPQGGHVGPDLSKIGAIRSGRDLLEAIVFPSASFARGFEPYTIATDDGRVHAGIIARESSEVIDLVAADRSVLRLPRSSIEAIERGGTSIMPQGMDGLLTRQELTDLVAFLGSLK